MEIFEAVVDQPADVRSDLLDSLCLGDEAIKSEVQRMLNEDARESSLLDSPLGQAAHSLIDLEDEKIPERFFGPYRLVRLLGEGGMGVVYLARRDDLGSQAAIKILRDSALSPMRRQRFASERRMLAQLNHPFIARLYDADTLEDGTPYIVMEYVEGEPLTAYTERRNLTIDEVVRLCRSVCEAVRYAHSQAIIHRDLKPSNILVTEDGTVKLLDFGIGKQLELANEQHGRTTTALRIMTPAYSAPEQIRGGPVGVQADVYSLGVVLYELLARRLPYDLSRQTPGQAERTIESGEPESPSTFGKRIDNPAWRIADFAWSELDIICQTAMHKDTERRYQSVEALIRDLDHYLKGEPLEARPDSLRYRAGKFIVRNRRVLTWTAAASLIAMVLAVFFTVRLARARREAAAEAARTRTIQRFMLNLFGDSDGEAGPSEDLRVTQLLDRGVKEATTLDQDPETEADLDQTLAGMYQNLGKFDRAEPLLKSALETRKRLYGPETPKVADTMVALGLLRFEQAQPEEAERLTRSALAIDQRALPPTDPAVARAKAAVGHVVNERGAYPEALVLLRQAVDVQLAEPQPAPDLPRSLSWLADANYYTAHYDIADRLDRQALSIDEKLYGKVHPRIADDLTSLGEIQHDLQHEQEAEKYYRQALDIKRSWYGEKNPDTAFCMMAVAQSLVYQKRYEEAAPLMQSSLAIQRETLGDSHPKVAMAYNLLGVLEQRRGHLDTAEASYSRMAEINRAVYGDRHYLVGVALMNLGQVYMDEKNYPRSEEFFRAALDRFVEKLPPNHPSIAIADQKLGMALVLDQKYKEAEAPLETADRIFLKQDPQPAERLAAVRKALVTVDQHRSRQSGHTAAGAGSTAPKQELVADN
jgi:serine/threonine-protein kinase